MLSRTEHRGVCRLLSSVMSGTESHTDREEDYRFLHSMLMEKKLHLLFKIHERLKRFEKRSPIPVQEHAASLASDLAEELIYQDCRDEVKELVALFSKPNFKGLLSVHDAVAQRDFEPTLQPIPDDVLEEDEDSVKIVSLVKTKDPLGATIKRDKSTGAIVVARIMRGGAADKSAVAFERGDVLQIVSMDDDTWWQACHLGDNNTRAGLIPSQQLHERRVALHRPKALFKPRRVKRPVLEDIVHGAITGIHIAGLRRSFRLGRQSILDGEAARSRRWRTGVHSSVCPPTYIEVIPYHRDPKERHRLVVLVGPSGVGVNELKRRLLISDPDHYGVTVPHTTREKRRQENEGVDYHFVSIHMFEEDILNNRFVEYGRHRGHYYGTSLDSVHRVMAEGKVCLLHVHPNKIKHVYTSEFKPYVVFVKPPHIQELRHTRRRAELICTEEDKNSVRIFSEEDFEDMINSAETMESQSGQLFDKVIVNGDIAVAFRELKAALEKVEEAEVQWIPAEWICSSPTKSRRSCGQLDSWI
ncbi:hypothetical protein FQN60_016276 [Etheostoma spectabile]|uniref:Guanylate kinase-like domain-containing protein n=1 Tax=Etheostoma spectabile TaxID=54343 RepID=A0A5J5D230_9PERO|nr:hypothetical protein FQN60_016276 [Etheostoma spectabile]